MTTERSLFEIIAAARPLPSTHDAILAAAGQVFIRHGYEGASMELVAQAAGVARRTVYNQFPQGKKALFLAVVERLWRSFPVMDIATDEDALANPEAGLSRIGHGIAALWGPPLAVAFLRMLIGEAGRFPELMQGFFQQGKTRAVGAVTDYISELARRGILSIEDPHLATRQFLGLIDESILWVRVMGDESALPQPDVDHIVGQAVTIFLGHYRPA